MLQAHIHCITKLQKEFHSLIKLYNSNRALSIDFSSFFEILSFAECEIESFIILRTIF